MRMTASGVGRRRRRWRPETLSPGQIVTLRKLRDENSQLKRRDLRT